VYHVQLLHVSILWTRTGACKQVVSRYEHLPRVALITSEGNVTCIHFESANDQMVRISVDEYNLDFMRHTDHLSDGEALSVVVEFLYFVLHLCNYTVIFEDLVKSVFTLCAIRRLPVLRLRPYHLANIPLLN
jgi:hypothetical protein